VELDDFLLRSAVGLGKISVTVLPDGASQTKLIADHVQVVVFGAMAGRLVAASGHGGNGTRSKITQAEELVQELGSLRFQSCQLVRVSFLYRISSVRI
jgi:hypothetical protein